MGVDMVDGPTPTRHTPTHTPDKPCTKEWTDGGPCRQAHPDWTDFMDWLRDVMSAKRRAEREVCGGREYRGSRLEWG